jgi:hypothetical protein
MPDGTQAPEQQFSLDAIMAKYIELRDTKDLIMREAKEKCAGLDKALDTMSAYLHKTMQDKGLTSVACSGVGTAFIKSTDFAGVQDWNLALDFIQKNGLWQMLKKDVNKTAVKEYIDANPQGLPPPGVNWGSKVEVQVRRAS